MTVKEALKSVHAYPIPDRVLANTAEARELTLEIDITVAIRQENKFKLAEADLLVWVSQAPNVSEEGVSFDMLVTDRKELRERANRIYGELGDPKHVPPASNIANVFTYQGEDI